MVRHKLFLYALLMVVGITSVDARRNYILVDFGLNTLDNLSGGFWNNVSDPLLEGNVNLVYDQGDSTHYVLKVNDLFTGSNALGAQKTNGQAAFVPPTASTGSFFGNTKVYGSSPINNTAGFLINGLDTTKFYTFSFFGSRNNLLASENRETKYIVKGISVDSVLQNTANNTSKLATVYNMRPDSAGVIKVSITAGPNNNNIYGFYHINALRLTVTDDTIKSASPIPYIKLLSPVANVDWEAKKTNDIEWMSRGIDSLKIEYTNYSGQWTKIATVAGNLCNYTWSIPDSILPICRIRLSGADTYTVSDVFSIIPTYKKHYKIVVLGSSTAAGTGATSLLKSWVYLYQKYMKESDSRFEVVNLAVPGYTTYNLLSTGSYVPPTVIHKVDTLHNITAALKLNADVVIVNLPGNDVGYGYNADIQLANYLNMKRAADSANCIFYVCTVQPKNFVNFPKGLAIQLNILQKVRDTFKDHAIDFWSGLSDSIPTYYLQKRYDSGDGSHMNDAGHFILFQRMLSKNIKKDFNLLDNILTHSISSHKIKIDILNSKGNLNDGIYIRYYIEEKGDIELNLYNINGSIVKTIYKGFSDEGYHTIELDKSIALSKGFYVCTLHTKKLTCSKKLPLF